MNQPCGPIQQAKTYLIGRMWIVTVLLIGLALTAQPSLANGSTLASLLNDQAKALHLAEAPTWSSLLHLGESQPNIEDPSFLLSASAFSLEAELAKTLDFLYGVDPLGVCRFPARYLWLRQQLGSPALPIENCADREEFKHRAPAETISLVFASENLAQPSSIMGHLFLKLAGVTPEGTPVEHAISFYTDGNSLNLPKLLFDSMIRGKRGYFSLSPYQEQLRHYVTSEQRSVWEYELRLEPFRRELVQSHLIELKQTKLKYFFQKYNCATLINFILSVAIGSNERFDAGLWVSPKDVIKRANELQVVAEIKLTSPNRWLIRALRDQVSRSDATAIKDKVDRLETIEDAGANDSVRFVRLELAKAYFTYRLQNGLQTGEAGGAYLAELDRATSRYLDTVNLEPTQFKNPLFTPADSQLAAGVLVRRGEPFARVTFTPASHGIGDDNRSYFGESELILFELSVLKSLRSNALILDRLTICSVKSLLPYDRMSGGRSGRIRIGVEPQLDRDLSYHRAAFVSGGAGRTARIGTDIDLYATASMGLGYMNSSMQVYAAPEAGVVIREVFNMKSVVALSKRMNVLGTGASPYDLRAIQSVFFGRGSVSANFEALSSWQRGFRSNQVSLTLKKLF